MQHKRKHTQQILEYINTNDQEWFSKKRLKTQKPSTTEKISLKNLQHLNNESKKLEGTLLKDEFCKSQIRSCNVCKVDYSRYWRTDLEKIGWLCNNCGMNQRRCQIRLFIFY